MKTSNFPVYDLVVNGKLPPQAVDVEEQVLGAILTDPAAIFNIINLLKPDDFYKESNGLIYAAAVDMVSRGTPIDITLLIEEMKKAGSIDMAGGAFYINSLVTGKIDVANISYYGAIVKQHSMLRELIKNGIASINKAYEHDADPFELLEELRDSLDAIDSFNVSGNVAPRNRAEKTLEMVKSGMNKGGLTGVPSGITSVDKFTGGFQKGDLIFVGGRPGNFKTALILAMAHNMDKLGFTPYISQQEMAEEQTGMRELAMYSGIDTQDIRRGSISEQELSLLEAAATKLSKTNVLIDHTGGMSITQLKSNFKKINKTKKIDILMVDYLQLMNMELRGNNGTDEAMIAATTRKLKLMAKELNVPVIVLSQLSRAVESTNDKRPKLSHLKGSGAIEADADVVILLYNPSNYFENPVDNFGNSLKDKLELIFCKNRQGGVGSIVVDIDPATNTFPDSRLPKPKARPIDYMDNKPF